MQVEMFDGVLTVGEIPWLLAADVAEFRQVVRAALGGQTIVEVDLSQTMAMDCAGVGELVALRNLLNGVRGTMRLLHPTCSVRRLLHITGLGRVFDIIPASAKMGPGTEALPASKVRLQASQAEECGIRAAPLDEAMD